LLEMLRHHEKDRDPLLFLLPRLVHQ